MRLRALTLTFVGSAFVMTAAPAAAAQVYKWTDERGVVNYSNEPPARSRKDAVVVEDRLSVYTPDPEVVQAMQGVRGRRAAAGPGGSDAVERRPRDSVVVLAPPAAAAVDACANAGDANCAYVPYAGSPVFWGRQRLPVLVQPRLPAGATAGNVVGPSGHIPGLAAQAEALAPTRTGRPPRASFTLPPDRPGRGHRHR